MEHFNIKQNTFTGDRDTLGKIPNSNPIEANSSETNIDNEKTISAFVLSRVADTIISGQPLSELEQEIYNQEKSRIESMVEKNKTSLLESRMRESIRQKIENKQKLSVEEINFYRNLKSNTINEDLSDENTLSKVDAIKNLDFLNNVVLKKIDDGIEKSPLSTEGELLWDGKNTRGKATSFSEDIPYEDYVINYNKTDTNPSNEDKK